MMEYRLRNRLGEMEYRMRETRLLRKQTLVWTAAAGAELALILLTKYAGWSRSPAWWIMLIGAFIISRIIARLETRRTADYRALVKTIAQENPGARTLLQTAVEQQSESNEFSYLQIRVIEEALDHPHTHLWREKIVSKSESAKNSKWLALAGLLIVLCVSSYIAPANRAREAKKAQPAAPLSFGEEIAVAPGDTEIERGSGLVITARFRHPPAEATLVVASATGKTQSIPLARNFSDPVFGASLLEIDESAVYRIEYSGKKTRDYKIRVFEYPALVRADATLAYPQYTGLTNKTIRDTRRVSFVEGSRLTYKLQLNKPVTSARLVARDEVVPLTLESNAIAALNNVTLTNGARYMLQLIDAEGRSNKFQTEFVILVFPNKPPELRIAFPKGDQRVSSLQELQIEGQAQDDFGLLRYGIGYGVSGEDPNIVELGQSASANQKRQFTNVVELEKLKVEPDQLVSYFAWADDYDSNGQPRRTFSDIFFAEIRPFERIFRPDQSGASESQMDQNQGQGQGQSQGGGQQNSNLAELEKQIVTATWKLQQTKPPATQERKP